MALQASENSDGRLANVIDSISRIRFDSIRMCAYYVLKKGQENSCTQCVPLFFADLGCGTTYFYTHIHTHFLLTY